MSTEPSQTIKPDVAFAFIPVSHPKGRLVLLQIPAASLVPVKFYNIAYLRIGEAATKLSEYPMREAALIGKLRPFAWETAVARDFASRDDVLKLLNVSSYYALTNRRPPTDPAMILHQLEQDKLVVRDVGDHWDILNLGALLFANDLSEFETLSRKAVRAIEYQGTNRLGAKKEVVGVLGYAPGFERLLAWLERRLPSIERIEGGRRQTVCVYPSLVMRELIANALIHQDFSITGTGPMIEIFADRVEITNPGDPLIAPNRFLDSPPRSRNEATAALMRRMNFCEERGSGVDKVIAGTELAQLPAPDFLALQGTTQSILYGPRKFSRMSSGDRVRACYWHTVLKYAESDGMTNSSLRERFGLDQTKASQVSRIIRDTENAGLIKPSDSWNARTGFYLPSWA